MEISAGVPPEFWIQPSQNLPTKKIPRLLLGFPDNLLLLYGTKADYKYNIKYKTKDQINVIVAAEILIDLSLIA